MDGIASAVIHNWMQSLSQLDDKFALARSFLTKLTIEVQCCRRTQSHSLQARSRWAVEFLPFCRGLTDQGVRRWATIGLLLCKSQNRLVAEYALSGVEKPIGVAEYQLLRALPEPLLASLLQ